MVEKVEITDKRTAEEKHEDGKFEKARRMLESIKPGWSLTIERKRPGWCSGYLERLECTDDEAIDLEYIIEQWGGRIMKLRLCDERGKWLGGVDLNLQAWPPKHRGKIINQDTENHPGITKAEPTPIVAQQNPAAAAVKQPNIVELLGILQKTRSQDLSTLKMLFSDVTQQPQPVYQQPQSSLGGIDEVIHFAEKFKQLQGLFGSTEVPGSAGDDESGILGQVAQIAQMLQSNPAAPAKAKSPSRVVAPQPNPRQQVPPQVNPQQQIPPNQENGDQLTDVLAGMDEERYQQIFLTSLEKMPQDKSGRIVAGLMKKRAPNEVEEYEEEEYYDDDEESEVDEEHSET